LAIQQQFIKLQDKPTEDLNIVSNMKPLGETSEDVALDSSEYRHGNLELSSLSKSTMEAEKEMEENQPLKNIEENTQNPTDPNIRDAPNAVQSRDDSRSVPDDIDGQNVTDDNLSGVKQIIGGSIARALSRRLVLEQISGGSCSSPRSVLPQNILADQIPISNVDQRIQTDVPQSTTEDLGGDDSADDQPQENLTVNMPQNAQQLIDNSIEHPSGSCSLETLEVSMRISITHLDLSIH